MNHNIKIIADSTCDLSEEVIKKHDITVIPLCIVMNEKSYYDGLDITPDQIFQWSDDNKTTPKTAAITVDRGIEILKPFVQQGKDIIFIGISEQMSSTCNVVRLAREELAYDRIFVIDSMNLSTGIGLQVMRAAEMAIQGKSAEEIVEGIENDRAKVKTSFVIDTLVYLARGGRCSAITALLANTLKLKPVIVVKNGVMEVGRKYRGNLDHVLLKYAKDLEPDLRNACPDR
ncbi:MAG: DegV family protein, partial [Lachnoclostridium sp.]|nr:DegV family protein [Lachnoclostridium sp.]